MCGRFSQRFDEPERLEELKVERPVPELIPRYNLAPSQSVAMLRDQGEGRRLSLARWGLVPKWAEDVGLASRLINARVETANVKPAFRSAWRSRRCLIPANGYYEWSLRNGRKQPFYFRRSDGGWLLFAGLWEKWTVPEEQSLPGNWADFRSGEVLETCVILTTAALGLVAGIHHRMPVFLAPEQAGRWLAPGSEAPELRVPYRLEAYRVSDYVNNPRNDQARCVEPLGSQPNREEPGSLFDSSDSPLDPA